MGGCWLMIGMIMVAQSWQIIKCESNSSPFVVGALVDDTWRGGKQERVAMEMAVHDFNRESKSKSNRSLILLNLNLPSSPAAIKLFVTKKVEAILGPDSWQETSLLVAKFGATKRIPILSFANPIPKSAIESSPFLVQASTPDPDPHHHHQLRSEMKAVAAIVQSCEWYQVTVIYEANSPLNSALPHLFSALREVGTELKSLVEFPQPFIPIDDLLSRELKRLKEDQCRVFVVHSSAEFARPFFMKAKEMGMMEEGYVWIITNPIASLIQSFNASTLSSMEGVIGIRRSHAVPDLQDFYERFRKKIMSKYPEEFNHEPSSFAVQAYDATWRVAQAIAESNKDGHEVLRKILKSDCNRCLGHKFEDALKHALFQVINIVTRNYRELGFWSENLGFSKTATTTVGGAKYKHSIKSLKQVSWPGAPWDTPKGWAPLPSSKVLRVGVPRSSLFKQIMKYVDTNSSITGFAVDVFNATIKKLPFDLPYNVTPFDGTYNDLVKQISLKKFDAVIGDVSIVENRYEHAEFTYPFTETGLVAVVPVRSKPSGKEWWLFLKPFTQHMWVLIVVVNMYNGFVVWFIERNYQPDLNGSVLDRIGKLVWLAFSTLFSLQGGRLHSNLSRITMIVWLFVAMVITQTYTANLTSMLTTKQLLEPHTKALRSDRDVVGYCNGSYLVHYLKDVLKYPESRIKNFSSLEEYDQALKGKEIAGVFLEVPLAKLFLAKYCKGYTMIEPTYKVGGFGFAFAKGSPLVPMVSKTLVNISESGELFKMEQNMLESEKCEAADEEQSSSSIGLKSFWVLFSIAIATATISLLLHVFTVGSAPT